MSAKSSPHYLTSRRQREMNNTNGLIEEAEVIDQYVGSEIDLFISGISLEDRCPQGWNILKEKGIEVKNKIIFYFNEVIAGAEQKGVQNAEEYFDKLFDMQPTDRKLRVSIYDEVSGLMEFEKHLNEIFREVKDKKVVIDFSVMIKPYLFVLLKYLQHIKSIEKIYLLYTEPASYHKSKTKMALKDSEPFTNGSIKTGEIPSYSGSEDLTKETALIVLLGFEGIRTAEVVREVDPDRTIPINGFPAYRPEFKDISIISNEEILREPDIFKNLDYAPANDPFETKNVLEKIYSKYSGSYNMSIAPLGTKPMALGSCLFALQHADCRILYPYPLKYNLKVSKGWGATWLYIVTLKGKNGI